MAKKKDLTKTRELTESDTATRSGKALPTIEQLLGEAPAPSIDENVFMLKLKNPDRLDQILDSLSINSSLVTEDKVAVVLGPYSRSQVKALSDAKLLSRKDELLGPQNTWKSIYEVMSEIKTEKLLTDELTSTASLTESITETSPTEPGRELTNDVEVIKVVQVPDTVVRPPINERKKTELPAQKFKSAQSSSKGFNLFDYIPKNLPWERVAALGAIVGILVLWQFGVFSGAPHKKEIEVMQAPDSPDSWPEYLRPKSFEELQASTSPLLARISPILIAYEKGAKVVSETDLRMLKILAGPGSASLEARLVATNLLAALALSKSQTEEAAKLLNKILEIVPTDMNTLLNKSIVNLVARDLKEAKDLASTALRLCKNQGCWVSRALLGLIASEEGRWVESDENFKAAHEASRGSLFVTGLWLRSFKNAPKDLAKARSATLLTESLVLDPDLMVDSPLHAPLATQILLAESLRGFRLAVGIAPDALTEGQKKYLDWSLSRYELNPMAISSAEVLAKLRSESQALSQLASSYMEKEASNLEKSSELISRTINRFSGNNIKSSWPWSFAGDIQRNRGLLDQAVLFYEAALSRNPRDVNAVFGLALVLREKKDYKASFQKMEEARSLDANYVPVQLLRDRFEWQKYWLSK
jgi:tetratricopeptide (TPR) repeat protein